MPSKFPTYSVIVYTHSSKDEIIRYSGASAISKFNDGWISFVDYRGLTVEIKVSENNIIVIEQES